MICFEHPLVLFGGRYPPPKKKKIDAQNSHLWREIHLFQIIWLSIHQICMCVCFAVESNHPHRSISKKCTSMGFWALASDENAKLGKYLKVPKKYLMNWIFLPKEICMICLSHWLVTLYCWWTKSCTTKDDDYPIIYSVLTIPGGAGFRPSTVWWFKDWFFVKLIFFFVQPSSLQFGPHGTLPRTKHLASHPTARRLGSSWTATTKQNQTAKQQPRPVPTILLAVQLPCDLEDWLKISPISREIDHQNSSKSLTQYHTLDSKHGQIKTPPPPPKKKNTSYQCHWFYTYPTQ